MVGLAWAVGWSSCVGNSVVVSLQRRVLVAMAHRDDRTSIRPFFSQYSLVPSLKKKTQFLTLVPNFFFPNF